LKEIAATTNERITFGKRSRAKGKAMSSTKKHRKRG